MRIDNSVSRYLAARRTGANNPARGFALYQAEKARGTPDAKILEVLFNARDAQPSSDLERLHWKSASAAAQT